MTTLAPRPVKSLSVGRSRSIRVASVTSAPDIGTLRSALTSTRLPATPTAAMFLKLSWSSAVVIFPPQGQRKGLRHYYARSACPSERELGVLSAFLERFASGVLRYNDALQTVTFSPCQDKSELLNAAFNH